MSWETFRQEAGDWAARKWFGGHYKEAYGVDEAALEVSKAATDAAHESSVEYEQLKDEAIRIEALRAEVAAYDAKQPAPVAEPGLLELAAETAAVEAAPVVDPAIVEAPVGVPVEAPAPVEATVVETPTETPAAEAPAPEAGDQ